MAIVHTSFPFYLSRRLPDRPLSSEPDDDPSTVAVNVSSPRRHALQPELINSPHSFASSPTSLSTLPPFVSHRFCSAAPLDASRAEECCSPASARLETVCPATVQRPQSTRKRSWSEINTITDQDGTADESQDCSNAECDRHKQSQQIACDDALEVRRTCGHRVYIIRFGKPMPVATARWR